jgi:peptidyl-prolyl cis-trans isomerase C
MARSYNGGVKKRLVTLTALLLVACSGAKPTGERPSPGPSLPPPIDAETPLPSPLPATAARVNGNEIKTKYVELIALALLENAGNQPKDRAFAYRRALQQLIVRELLLENAIARKIAADDAKVEQAYNEARVAYRDDRQWLAFLAKQGLDADSFRTEIRTQQTVAALIGKEQSLVATTVTEEETKKFYEANPAMFDSGERLRARHIQIRVPGDATEAQKKELRARIEGILVELKKGGDFAALAKKFSEDQGSAGKGGELELFHRGQMVPPFEEAAFKLKPGQLSDVVETPFGFHVIKLEERLSTQKLPYEGVKGRIKELIVQKRRSERVEQLAGQLWAASRVETYL